MDSKSLLVEIVAYAPTAYYHCTHCEVAWRSMGVTNDFHSEQVASSLPSDLAEDYQKISDWVREVFKIQCSPEAAERLLFKVIDAASIEGFFKTIQYRIRHYPAIIVDRQQKFTIEQLSDASSAVERLVSKAAAA